MSATNNGGDPEDRPNQPFTPVTLSLLHRRIRTAFVRKGDRNSPPMVVIPGFAQNANDLAQVMADVLAYGEDLGQPITGTVIVLEPFGFSQVERRTGEFAFDADGCGTHLLSERVDECERMIQKLIMMGFIDPTMQKMVIVGHSLGALLAKTMAMRFAHCVGDVVLIDPPPITGWSALLSPQFWFINRALWTAGAIVRSAVMNEPVRLNTSFVHRAFIGSWASEEQLHRYANRLRGDSGRVFLTILLFWPWWKDPIRNAIKNGWSGKVHLVHCARETLFTRRMMLGVANTHLRQGRLRSRSGRAMTCLEEAHCWWAAPRDRVGTIECLQRVCRNAVLESAAQMDAAQRPRPREAS